MATTAIPIVQLVTRIPRVLRRRVKVHCLLHETTLRRFVVDAIRERLAIQKAAHAGETPRAAAR